MIHTASYNTQWPPREGWKRDHALGVGLSGQPDPNEVRDTPERMIGLKNSYTFAGQPNQIDTLDGVEIYAVTSTSEVWKSPDAGQTWNQLFINTAESIHGIAILDGVNFLITELGSIWASRDSGFSWQIVQNAPVNSNLGGLYKLNSTTAVTSYLFWDGNPMNIRQGLLKTDDAGYTWRELEPVPVFLVGDQSLAFKNSNPLIAIAVGTPKTADIYDEYKTIAKTTTGGESAQPPQGNSAWQLVNPPTTDQLKAVVYVGGSTWGAIGADGGIILSNNEGASWTGSGFSFREYITSITAVNGILYAGGDTGKLHIINQGVFYEYVIVPATAISCLKAMDNTLLFACAGNSIYKSSDGGQSWANTGTFSGNVTQIDSLDGIEVYLVTAASDVWKSGDSGISWSQILVGTSSPVYGIAIMDGVNYIVTEAGAVWQSYDGGNNWQVVDTLSGAGQYAGLYKISPTVAFTGYVDFADGSPANFRIVLTKTTNAGLTWSELEPLPIAIAGGQALAFKSEQVIVAVGTRSFVDRRGAIARTTSGGVQVPGL